MRQWDLLHCPPASTTSSSAPATAERGAHDRLDEAHYPVNEVAAKYGASVQTATDVPDVAYADWRTEARTEVSNPWPRT
jgi:hypothetical protein